MHSVTRWLATLGLAQYGTDFERNDIDLSLLSKLTDQDLRDLGVQSLGHRKKMLEAIAELKGGDAPESASGAVEIQSLSRGTSTSEGERRQLTVMFCDLVGSTALSEKLDPEELRGLLHHYRTVCGEVISRYDGFVARYVGDGILTYFGWPKAHEEDAERALRVALEIVQAVKRVSSAEPLSVRIGIATGPVVVGEQAGVGDQSKLAVGSTPNLAARLQGLAAADQIVIASSTLRLVGNAFELADLGEHELKGTAEPVHAWRVMAVSAAASRFEARHGAQVTPLVGREQEIGLLLDRWQQAQEGEGQVVLLSGEPGIGKSRILSTLRDRLENQSVATLRFQCSPYYVNSAFYPTIDNFERALKFARDESAESKLDKLEALVVTHYGRPLRDVRFIAALLSIPYEGRYGALAMTPQKHKDETLRTLVDLTEAAARKQPTAMLYEDAHWVDPTSLEVLDLLIDRVRAIPLLIVLTHRPEFQPKWGSHGHVTALNLSKLTRAQSGAIVSKIAGGKALPDDLLEKILGKTDGVPLYVEELTKAILESGELKDAGDHYHYVGTTRSVTIPATLRDSLTARLDRSPAAKEIAQIGAAIGREFSYELIAAVAPHTKTEFDSALNQLTESGLAFRRGTPPEAQYTFKHALVQDAAYDSLLKSRRQELHAKIARVLEDNFPATKDTEPELLAHHFLRSANLAKALDYLERANRKAAKANAMADARSYFEEALRVLDNLPDTVEYRRRRIALVVDQAHVYVLTNGVNDYDRCLESVTAIAEGLDDEWLLGKFYACRGHCQFMAGVARQAAETLRRAIVLCERTGNFHGLGHAYAHLQWSQLQLGEYEDVLATEPDSLRALAEAPDPRLVVYSLTASAWACAMLGKWDLGIEKAQASLRESERAGDESLVSFTYTFSFAIVYRQKGAIEDAIEYGHRAVSYAQTLAEKQWAEITYGWAILIREPDAAIDLLEPIVSFYRSLESIWLEGVAAVRLGEAYLRVGRLADARATFERTIEVTGARGMRLVSVSAERLLAETLLAEGALNQARTHFESVVAELEQSNAQSELALACDGYGRVLARQGQVNEARRYLTQALIILEQLGMHGESRRVRAEFDVLAVDS